MCEKSLGIVKKSLGGITLILVYLKSLGRNKSCLCKSKTQQWIKIIRVYQYPLHCFKNCWDLFNESVGHLFVLMILIHCWVFDLHKQLLLHPRDFKYTKMTDDFFDYGKNLKNIFVLGVSKVLSEGVNKIFWKKIS